MHRGEGVDGKLPDLAVKRRLAAVRQERLNHTVPFEASFRRISFVELFDFRATDFSRRRRIDPREANLRLLGSGYPELGRPEEQCGKAASAAKSVDG